MDKLLNAQEIKAKVYGTISSSDASALRKQLKIKDRRCLQIVYVSLFRI